MRGLTKEQREFIDKNYLSLTDGEIGHYFGCSKWQVMSYRQKVGLVKSQGGKDKFDSLASNSLLMDEIENMVDLDSTLSAMESYLKPRYSVSRHIIKRLIEEKIHWSTRRRWQRALESQPV